MSIHSYIYEDAQVTSAACAIKILSLLEESLSAAPLASFAISGGSTPKLLFGELAKAGFDWSRVHLFWVDERGVPPNDPQSNYKLAKEHLIDAARFPASNVHRIQAELEPETAARLYAEDIAKFFGLRAGAFPQFDIIHRGMGPDAHTASLFPGNPLIDNHEGLVGATYIEKFEQWRITLLPGVLQAARNTIMLVAGEDKAEPLRTVLHEPYDPQKYPVQIGTHDGNNVLWFLDKAAARLLN
jgi:6-phosphogluconolactonase